MQFNETMLFFEYKKHLAFENRISVSLTLNFANDSSYYINFAIEWEEYKTLISAFAY